MKNILTGVILILAFSSQIKGQDLSENELIGSWKVLKVQSTFNEQISKEQMATLEKVNDAFRKSKFHFKADKNFTFDFELEDMQIKNGHWKYSKLTNSILIQEWKDKDKEKPILMEFIIKKDGDKIFFIITETFTTLEMQKE